MALSNDYALREDELSVQVEQAIGALRLATAERDRLFSISRELGNTEDGVLAALKAADIWHQGLQRLRAAFHDFETFTRGSQNRS
jgi:hypothetical protein